MEIEEIRTKIAEQTRNGRTSVYINIQELMNLGLILNGLSNTYVYIDANDLETFLDAAENCKAMCTYNQLTNRNNNTSNIKMME